MRDQVLIRKLESKINIFKNENTTNYEPQGWKHIKNIAKRHGGMLIRRNSKKQN